ncbi:hypothetical protein GRJ2_000727600 [Grus japonensis]|uniref:Uncharacterized protein n=1 Tax=Grus japonensis TaxID=30415 RepID=A0ABC9WB81_GRUJA
MHVAASNSLPEEFPFQEMRQKREEARRRKSERAMEKRTLKRSYIQQQDCIWQHMHAFKPNFLRFNVFGQKSELYSEKDKKEGSIIGNEMQHIAMKIFKMRFDFGFNYEHFF